MSVYVDILKPCAPSRVWRWGESCHLLADSGAELHEFARRLGLERSWFQARSVLPHYDLTAGKRETAVRLGATEIGDQDVVGLMRRTREAKK
ncbi:MAG TPA: DUF4031 domain-containing protein [Phycisphaerae bacterium]|nr:DUF4031 domain-containing protein [Phycisphaerae bacterium]HUX03005.1 DUF4031 domain-containing protein [Phycisphaerae bacterium]